MKEINKKKCFVVWGFVMFCYFSSRGNILDRIQWTGQYSEKEQISAPNVYRPYKDLSKGVLL